MFPSSWPAMVPQGVRTTEHGHDSPLQIDVSADGAVVTVVVAGELDIITATNLFRRLFKIGAARPERLVLDLSGLVCVDVAGAWALGPHGLRDHRPDGDLTRVLASQTPRPKEAVSARGPSGRNPRTGRYPGTARTCRSGGGGPPWVNPRLNG